MGLRCSLLGHDFGEAELDRDREERGDEVVITIREVKTCRRCGDERVLSENTEVRPVEPIGEVESDGQSEPSDAGASDGETAGESTTAGPQDGDEGSADVGAPDEGSDASADEDVAFIDADAEADAAVDPGDASAGGESATDAATDDGVIIDDEGAETEPERTAGEWPDATDTRVDERDVPAAAGPEVEVEADGEDAELIGDEPEVDEGAEAEAESGTEAESEAESDATTDETPESGVSEWPDPKGEDHGFDAEPGGESTDVEFSGIAPEGDSGAVATTPSESPSMAVDTETAFVCPECGFAKPAAKASLRAGDICPECKKGYLKEE